MRTIYLSSAVVLIGAILMASGLVVYGSSLKLELMPFLDFLPKEEPAHQQLLSQQQGQHLQMLRVAIERSEQNYLTVRRPGSCLLREMVARRRSFETTTKAQSDPRYLATRAEAELRSIERAYIRLVALQAKAYRLTPRALEAKRTAAKSRLGECLFRLNILLDAAIKGYADRDRAANGIRVEFYETARLLLELTEVPEQAANVGA